MKKVTIFFAIVVVIAGLAIAASALILGMLRERTQERLTTLSSDAPNLTERVRMAGDGWAGYSVFRSPLFREGLESRGIGLDYTDDNADYGDRMAKLAAGEYDLIVTTLDAYLLNAREHDYPGVVIFVVDESKGGDGIVAGEEVGSIADLARPGVRIALTPASPSEFFLRSVAAHFDLAPLKAAGSWRVEADGSSGALRLLRGGEVDAAVLWEPELSTAAADQRFRRLIATDQTAGLIVDVCVASRQLVVDKPDLVRTFTETYFSALRTYQADPGGFADLIAKDTDTDKSTAERILGGINFVSLTQNATRWFGLGGGDFAREQLVSSVRSNIDILVETGAFGDDPLGGSPRRIINSSFIQDVYTGGGGARATSGVFQTAGAAEGAAAGAGIVFRELSDAQWAGLPVLGRLKVRPIYFQSGTSLLTLEGKHSIDRIVQDLEHYPTFRLLVRGHTKPEGDEQANQTLSRDRARAVANYLARTHDIPAARMRVEGVGGTMPLEQEEGESHRRWMGRQPRVELLLVEDPTL